MRTLELIAQSNGDAKALKAARKVALQRGWTPAMFDSKVAELVGTQAQAKASAPTKAMRPKFIAEQVGPALTFEGFATRVYKGDRRGEPQVVTMSMVKHTSKSVLLDSDKRGPGITVKLAVAGLGNGGVSLRNAEEIRAGKPSLVWLDGHAYEIQKAE